MGDSEKILITGDYIRNTWSENDRKMESFYAKYPHLRESELDFTPQTETPTKDYLDHFFKVEWDRIKLQSKKGKSQPGFFKIGTVALTVPPSQIAISDVKNNFTYSTLRSRGDITLQSGHTNKVIDLDVIFHDVDSINNKLRPLLAQLRCTPFIPIENEYIRSVISPEKTRIKAFSAARDGRVDELIKSKEKWESNINNLEAKIKELINNTTFYEIYDGDSALVKEQKEQNESKVKTNLALFTDGQLDPKNRGQVELEKSITYNVKKALGDANNKEAANIVDGVISKIEKLEIQKNSYQEDISNTLRSLPFPSEHESIVPAVLSQITISTIPGSPESLACHMSFFIFNCLPYSANFSFRKTVSEIVKICPYCKVKNEMSTIECSSCRRNIRDSKEETISNISPTKNIDECDSFVKWYSKTFLSDKKGAIGRIDSIPSDSVRFETTRGARRVEDGKYHDYQALLSLDLSYFLAAECVSLAISFSNRIKFLPIIGYGVPTCQYLGSNSSSVSMTFSSFPEKDSEEDIFLESMRFFFDQVDATSRETIKNNRRAWVRVDNDIVKMAGIENLIPQSFDVNTVPGSPGMSTTTIRFIDINTTFEEREMIRLLNAASDEMIDAFIEEEIRKWGSVKGSGIISDCLAEIKSTGPDDAFLPRLSTLGLFSSVSGNLIDKRSDLIWADGPTDQFVYKYYAEAAKATGFGIKKAKYSDKELASYFKEKGLETGISGIYNLRLPDSWAKAAGVAQTRIDSSVFDTIWTNGPGHSTWEPLSIDSREIIFHKVLSDFYGKGLSGGFIDPAISRLLFRGTKAGQEQIDKWVKLLEAREKGQGELPEGIERILERDETSTQRSPAYWTYEDLDLPVYADIGIGYAPTFNDLGIPAPPSYGASSLARNEYDIVEPDFYFDHLRVKDSDRATFNFDAGSWGPGSLTFDIAKAKADKMHVRQGSKMVQDIGKKVKQQGTLLDKEKEAIKNQKEVGLVDRQAGGEGVAKDKVAEHASRGTRRIPVEGMHPSDILEGVVSKIIDGDTIMIEGYDDRIRIIGINTPELNYKNNDEGRDTSKIDEENSAPGAVEAKKRAESLLLDKKVRLRIDQFNAGSNHRGVYGRPLMYVYIVGGSGSEIDFGGIMLDEGLAEVKQDFPFTKQDDYAPRSSPKHKIVSKKDIYGRDIVEEGNYEYGADTNYGPEPIIPVPGKNEF